MTYKVHGFLNNKRVLQRRLEHLPRIGDTVRLDEKRYVKVTEIVWCMDEDESEGQRVNIGMETENDQQN